MCYSAQVIQQYGRYVRQFGAILSKKEYVRQFWDYKEKGSPYRYPKAMLDAFNHPRTEEEREIHALIQDIRAQQAGQFEQELFKQKKRLADAERTLQVQITKKAQNDQRIATNKIGQLKAKIEDLKRTRPLPRDSRIFPSTYCTVLASEGGQRFVAPMRYQCRPAGKPALYDQKYPGTYNARRDNLG